MLNLASDRTESADRMVSRKDAAKGSSSRQKDEGGGFLSKRVERNLDSISAQWERELGAFCARIEKDSMPLWRKLFLYGVDELGEIRLGYEIARRLLATLYTLVYDFEVSVPPDKQNCSIELRLGRFECVSGSSRIPELLNTSLVKERMEALGITDIRMEVVSQERIGRVRMVGLVGSSTWNMIPPVLHSISFREGECIKAVELMRMIAVALRG